MAQAPGPVICHYNTVEPRSQNNNSMPWRYLDSRDYANYIHKWCKLVRINQGNPDDWGNWGVQIDGAGMLCVVLEVTNDYVLIEGAEQIGPNQAIQSISDPAIVWSRYLRPILRLHIPRLVQWTHVLDDRYHEKNYLKLGPAQNNQDMELVQGTFHVELEKSNFHQILAARDYAKFVYKWGELVKFGKGKISETGHWGLQDQFFNFRHDLFVVLSARAQFVLITRTSLHQNAITEEPNFESFWVWSRVLRLHTRLEFPRTCDWFHPWEPQTPTTPAIEYRFSGPQNQEE